MAKKGMSKSRVIKQNVRETRKFNYAYLVIALVVIVLAAFLIVYLSKPKVSPSPGANLVLYLKLNAGSGTSAYDSSTHKDGDIRGSAPNWTTGIDGKALTLDGINDYINVGDFPLISGEHNLTAMIWFKASNIPSAPLNNPIPLIMKYKGDDNKDYGLGIANQKIYFGYESNGNGWDASPGLVGQTTISGNVWHFAAFTYNNVNKKVKLYLDGKLEGSATLPTTTPDTDTDLRIGSRHGTDNLPDKFFAGTVDEIMFSSDILADSDIRSTYLGYVCGNGIVDAGEACDRNGTVMGVLTCQSPGIGFTSPRGFLSCSSTCDVVTSSCVNITCGDGVIEGKEVCDNSSLGSNTCANINQGFASGNLSCNSTCGFNTAQCVKLVIAGCGNGIVDAGESCDWNGTKMNGKTCQTELGRGGNISCNLDCTLNTTLCSTCGNNITEGIEVCDGADLNSRTCSNLGYAGGNLSCKADCSDYNKSKCNLCGDGIIETGEQCDGSNVTSNCTNFGFKNGTLACNSSCNFVTSSCNNVTSLCGNNLINTGEQCDGTNITSSCTSLGFASGNISCNAGCTFNTTKCVPKVNCTDSCASLGYKCGTAQVCGSYVNCGGCSSSEVCSNGNCIEQEMPSCTDSCSSLGFQCGSQTICGSQQDCGSCASGTCDSSGICQKKSSLWIWILIIILILGIVAIVYYLVKSGKIKGFKSGAQSNPAKPSMPQMPPAQNPMIRNQMPPPPLPSPKPSSFSPIGFKRSIGENPNFGLE